MPEIFRRIRDLLRQGRAAAAWRLPQWSAFAQGWLRVRLTPRVTYVGITGSAGKTTTKDLVHGILEQLAPCHRTPVTYNDAAGVAHTLAGLRASHRYAVLEVAGGEPGDMDVPLKLFRPDIAVLTLVRCEHVKSANALPIVAREKGRLIRALGPRGVAVLNIDDPHVREIGQQFGGRILWVGCAEGADVRLLSASSRWPEPLRLEVEVDGVAQVIHTRLHGTHLALPVIAALGVAKAAGVPLEVAVRGLSRVEPPEGRMQVVDAGGGVSFVRDDWKAAYWSFEAPFKFMREATAARRVLVLGTFSDYSNSAARAYRKIARAAQDAGELLVFVGPHAARAARGADPARTDVTVRAFAQLREASRFLHSELRAGDLVLLKGSSPADHLVRLLLDRTGRVECWLDRCGVTQFCTSCPRLGVPGSPPAVAPPSQAPSGAELELDVDPEGAVVVAGLGNPGERYASTRHNVGQMLLARLAPPGARWSALPEGELLPVSLGGARLLLFRPAVEMNNSGAALERLLARLKLRWQDCLVLHDDFDLLLGRVKYKAEGSDAGHRGVRSILERAGGFELPRVRIGVRRPEEQGAARGLALEPFGAADLEALEPAFEQALGLVASHCSRVAGGLAGRMDAA